MTKKEIAKIKKEWQEYKKSLMVKYPCEEGQKWKFTCPHHIRLDKMIEEM